MENFLGKACDNCKPLVAELLKIIEDHAERLEKVEIEVQKLSKINVDLESKITFYENPHRPPSLQKKGLDSRAKRSKENKAKAEPKGIPGQKPGHKGVTRKQPKPRRFLSVLAHTCVKCESKLRTPAYFEKKIIEEMPKPQPVWATEFNIAHYDCDNCGEHVVAGHPDLPKKGIFGKNILAQVAMMRKKWRMPYRKVCDAMETLYDLVLTPATVLDIDRRVSEALEPDYEQIAENIRHAPIVYSDETSAPVNGENHWTWAFSTPTDVLFAVRESRSEGVIDEILGEDFDGAMVNDGWKPYWKYAEKRGLQMGRCWAHIFEEADDLAEKFRSAKKLSDKLHNLFNDLVAETKKNPSMPKRKRLKKNALRSLKRLTEKRYSNQKVHRFARKLERARVNLLTFVVVPGMEPTNNRSERNLRENVVQRNIMKTFRNRKGTRIHEILMSVLTTWQLNGLNCYQELLRRLS